MNDDNNTINTTAGLFIEESDDDDNDINNDIDNQDDDLKINDNNNNNNNNNNLSMNTQELLNNINNNNDNNNNNNNNNLIMSDDDIDDDDDDDDDDTKVSSSITELTIAWQNEKLAPEILEYHEYAVNRVKQAIDDKEDEIEMQQDDININNNKSKIISSTLYWYKKEIERIKYILHSYLRVRIWKIQKYCLYILSNQESWNKLSESEQDFASSYSDLLEANFKNSFLRELPTRYQKINDPNMIVKPNLNKFIIVRANQNNDNYLIENGTKPINIQTDNIFVSRYKNLKHLIADGTVELI